MIRLVESWLSVVKPQNNSRTHSCREETGPDGNQFALHTRARATKSSYVVAKVELKLEKTKVYCWTWPDPNIMDSESWVMLLSKQSGKECTIDSVAIAKEAEWARTSCLIFFAHATKAK
jgi:hypothetical protein